MEGAHEKTQPWGGGPRLYPVAVNGWRRDGGKQTGQVKATRISVGAISAEEVRFLASRLPGLLSAMYYKSSYS